jgi:hypothetical protein
MASLGSNKGAVYNKWLRINSAQRVQGPGYSDSNFIIDLGQNVQKIKQISVHSCQFSNVFYNVFETNVKFNNWFHVHVGDGSSQLFGDHFVRIPPGYYSIYTLTQAISDALDDLDPGSGANWLNASWTFNTTTNMYTLGLGQQGAALGSPGGYITTVTADDLKNPLVSQWTNNTPPKGRVDYWPFGMLGFDSKISFTTLPQSPAETSFSAIYMPSLNNPSVAYITSYALAPSNSFDEKGSMSNILIPVNINVPFGNLVVFECKQDVLCEINYGRPRALDRIDIQLVDHDLDPLDLSQSELNLDLKVWLNSM